MLTCCPFALDYVIHIAAVFDPGATAPRANLLEGILNACLNDPFIVGGKVNGVVNGLPPVGSCYPFFGIVAGGNLQQRQTFPQASHGYFTGAYYFAGKVRWRIPTLRRWCLSSCTHVTERQNCGGNFACDVGGNGTMTILPPAGELILLPEPFVGSEPFTQRRTDYTWKMASFDNDPPSSPFCGLP